MVLLKVGYSCPKRLARCIRGLHPFSVPSKITGLDNDLYQRSDVRGFNKMTLVIGFPDLSHIPKTEAVSSSFDSLKWKRGG